MTLLDNMLVGAGRGQPPFRAALYYRVLRHDPHNPDWPERDRFVLCKGHAAPIQYAALAHTGYFPREDLMGLRKIGEQLSKAEAQNQGFIYLVGTNYHVTYNNRLGGEYKRNLWDAYNGCRPYAALTTYIK